MSSDSDDNKYMDFEAWWDPYSCRDQFFTSTAEFDLHKFMLHGKRGKDPAVWNTPYYDPFEDDYDYEVFADMYGSFEDSEDSEESLDSKNEFLDDYLTKLRASIPAKKSKGKRKKSSLKIAKVSQAACKDRITYSCSQCKKMAFNVKAEYLIHTAVVHGICGVCDYICQAAQRMGDAGFRDEEHYKYGPNCVRNPKGKLGSGNVGVDIKKEPRSSDGDRRSFICLTCGDTQSLIKSLKCRVCSIGLVVPMPPPLDDLFDDEDDYSEDDDDFFGKNFGCLDGHFDSEEDCYVGSEDEAMTKYIYLTSMRSSPSSKSKKKSKKSASENACGSQAGSSDHLPYACSKCGMGPFPAKGPFLLHVAMFHKTCGVCEKSCRADQKIEFSNEDHYSYAPGCVRNAKGECGDRGVDNHHKEPHSRQGNKDLFVCLTCGDNQGSGKALNQHYVTIHNKCRTCRIQFGTEDNLYRHFSSSKVHLQKFCVLCKMVFCSKESLQIHCAASHPTGNNHTAGVLWWPCDACTKTPRAFPTEDDLEVHLQCEHLRCFPCKREFVQKKSLDDHLVASSKHNFCIRCESDFVTSQAFISHNCPGIKAQNESLKSFRFSEIPIHNLSISETQLGRNKFQAPDLSCCVCEETFDSLEERMWHEYDNHLWCSKCDKQLASRRAFNEHQVACEGHSMCFECGDYFLTPEKLVHHQQITKHTFPFAKIPSNCNVKMRKFVCDSCDYKVVFQYEKELTMHLSIHD